MAEEQELSMEEILASIRNILWEKEVNKSASRSCIRDYAKESEGEVFQLTKDMLVKGWALPYEYSDWNFDDVASKILHKYADFFARAEKATLKASVDNAEPSSATIDKLRDSSVSANVRVSEKEGS